MKQQIIHKLLEEKSKSKKFFEKVSCDCFLYGEYCTVIFLGKEVHKGDHYIFTGFTGGYKEEQLIIVIESGSIEVRINKIRRVIDKFNVSWGKHEGSDCHSVKEYELISSIPFEKYGL